MEIVLPKANGHFSSAAIPVPITRWHFKVAGFHGAVPQKFCFMVPLQDLVTQKGLLSFFFLIFPLRKDTSTTAFNSL